ncbi:MAG: molybdopterin-dependent oxidoreductase, partial [Dermatophilaceae bacterium]
AHFGTSDKAVLQGSVLLVTLGLAAVAGLIAARRRRVGAGIIAVLVGLAGLAAMTRPTARPADLVPALAALIVGVAVLLGLARLADGASPVARSDTGEARQGPSRRGFVGGTLGVAVISALALAAGQVRAGVSAARRLVLPPPASPAPPLPVGLEMTVPGVSALQTPATKFYRVDTNLAVPQVDLDSWRLEIDGMVDTPFSLTFAELSALPLIERDITLTCVSNEVGGAYVGSARWLGVRLTDLLDRAGVRGRPDQVLSTAVDGFTISTPLAAVRDGRDAMVAIGMNGQSLTDVHGFPARLVTPGLYGFVGATKWLTRLTLTTYAAEQAYWTKRQWVTDAPIKTSARIDTPAPLSTISAGRVAIGGVAWAQHRGVGSVEVRVDDGPWQPARLGPDIGVDSWRQWYLPWDATVGLHHLSVRATDLTGAVQLEKRATPFPGGSSGIQDIVVTVS